MSPSTAPRFPNPLDGERNLRSRARRVHRRRRTARLGCFGVGAREARFFLDEIGEMPAATQSKLLRVLEDDHKIRRLGSKWWETAIDVRVLAATNKNPEQAVADGHMRQDLYFRLNVFHINLPPLRDHKQGFAAVDRSSALGNFWRSTARKSQVLARDVMDIFKSYSWPGNIRELRNVLELAAAIATGPWHDRALASSAGLLATLRWCLPPDLAGFGSPVGTTGGKPSSGELIFQTLAATHSQKQDCARPKCSESA